MNVRSTAEQKLVALLLSYLIPNSHFRVCCISDQ